MEDVIGFLFSVKGIAATVGVVVGVAIIIRFLNKVEAQQDYQLNDLDYWDIDQGTVERMNSTDEDEFLSRDYTQEQIVGIVEPLGYWTQRIIEEQLLYLKGMQKTGKGFWQAYINATSAKRHSKGSNRSGR